MGRERDAVVVGHCRCCLSVVVVVVVAHCCCCPYGVHTVYGSIYSLVDLIKKEIKKKIPLLSLLALAAVAVVTSGDVC